MAKAVKRIVVTGAAGHVAYAALFRIANGDMLGYDQPISLHLQELPQFVKALEGVKMELEDCAFPLLKGVTIGSDPREVFAGAHYALLIGSKPRGPGMERSDLLTENGKIFVGQGEALNDVADPDVKVLVVGNPCNTNCLIAMNHAPRIPRRNFFAMTRLDQNRASYQLARKAGVPVKTVTRMTIWGNHSTTQVPDFVNAQIGGRPAGVVIKDAAWFEGEFIPLVQKRGAAIIAARGQSSAASAANAVIDAIRGLVTPTPAGDWFSLAVCTDGNPYGIQDNMIFSFPCRSEGDGHYHIIPDVPWNGWLQEKIQLSEKELLEEKSTVGDLVANVTG